MSLPQSLPQQIPAASQNMCFDPHIDTCHISLLSLDQNCYLFRWRRPCWRLKGLLDTACRIKGVSKPMYKVITILWWRLVLSGMNVCDCYGGVPFWAGLDFVGSMRGLLRGIDVGSSACMPHMRERSVTPRVGFILERKNPLVGSVWLLPMRDAWVTSLMHHLCQSKQSVHARGKHRVVSL